MNKSHKQRYMELIGLTENAQKKQLSNETFKNLTESYQSTSKDKENSKQGKDMKVEKFKQKRFKKREEDADLYDLTNETFEVELNENLLSEAYEQFKKDATDDLEDALLNNYQNISSDQIRGFVREFLEFLDTSESIQKK